VAAPVAQGSAEPGATNLPAANQQPAGAGEITVAANAGDSKDAAAAAKATEPEPAADTAVARKAADNSAKPKNEPAATPPARAVPAGSVGVVDKVSGVLLRFNTEKREWERIAEGTTLAAADRLLCLEPFRARILIARTPVTLIGETQVQLTTKTADEPLAFELAEGRALIDGSAPTGSLKIGFAGLTVSIDRPSHGAVGLERISPWHYGQPPTQLPPLAIHAQEGDLSLALDGTKETLAGPGTLVADPGGRFQPRTKRDLPTWVTETEQSQKDQKLGEQFLAQFSKDRPLLADTVLATESDSPVTKKLAILAVKALGDLSFLTPILSRENDRSARQSTAAALRAFLSRGPLAAKQLRTSLGEEFGEQTGQVIEKLLIGYSADEAARKETHQRLVDLLSPRAQSLAVRELALDNLKTITGRNDQGYDPESPDEKGYNAWKSLLNKNEIKPAPKRPDAG